MSLINFLSNIKYYGYMTGSILEAIWGGDLYLLCMSESEEEIIKNLQIFELYFPHSNYLPIIKDRLESYKNKNTSRARLTNKIIFLEMDYYSSLEQIIKRNFNKKFVFVDLWATWCSPCLYQLKYRKQIESFLKT